MKTKLKSLALNSAGAFSLIELIITISIVAIVSTIGFMNLINHRQERDINFTAQEIVSVLRNAQSYSMTQEEGSRWGVYFSNPTGDNNDFYEFFKGSSYVGGTVVSRVNLRSGDQFNIPASGASSSVIFIPVTGELNASTSIVLSLKNNSSVSFTININKSGQIHNIKN